MTKQPHHSPHDQPLEEDGDGGSAGVGELVDQFSRVARVLEAEDDIGAMLEELVASAVQLVPGVQGGSISLVTGRTRVTSEHPSGELPLLVDAIQTETGQGPCLDAVYEQQTVRVPDMAHEQRWPKFAQRAFEAGAGTCCPSSCTSRATTWAH